MCFHWNSCDYFFHLLNVLLNLINTKVKLFLKQTPILGIRFNLSKFKLYDNYKHQPSTEMKSWHFGLTLFNQIIKGFVSVQINHKYFFYLFTFKPRLLYNFIHLISWNVADVCFLFPVTNNKKQRSKEIVKTFSWVPFQFCNICFCRITNIIWRA